MSESSEEELSDLDIDDIFGDSDEEEEFGGFDFSLPTNITWEEDNDGTKTRRFYEQNPRDVFRRDDAGPTINTLPGVGNAVDIFQLFLSDEMLEKIARWTNRWFEMKKTANPNKHKTPFEPIQQVQELKAYFGILLAINQNVDLPRYEHYFRQDESKWLFLTPGFHKVFSLQRFTQLNRYICFCDPDTLVGSRVDKIEKVRLLIEHLQTTFKDNFNCGKNKAIDEAMIPFKGKLSIKQRIMGKPIRWGIKLFELCDSETAYASRFEVYLGKDNRNEAEDSSAIGKCGAVVARLTTDFQNKGHHLFIDNWYTSLALCLFLKVRGIYVCGTTRTNRKGHPTELKEFKARGKERGESIIRVHSGVVAMAWKDSQIVNFMSTIHYPDEVDTVIRNQKDRRTGHYEAVEVPSHKLVTQYNENMGAVDQNDQMTSVRKSRKQLRWYMRVAIKGLELAAYNAYVIEGFFKDHFPEQRRKRDFMAFREDLILQLIGPWRTNRARPGRKRKESPFRLEVGNHFPMKGEGKDHTCEVCREKRRRYISCNPSTPVRDVPYKMTKTTFKCMSCDVYLCITRESNCFHAWHTQSEYWKY